MDEATRYVNGLLSANEVVDALLARACVRVAHEVGGLPSVTRLLESMCDPPQPLVRLVVDVARSTTPLKPFGRQESVEREDWLRLGPLLLDTLVTLFASEGDWKGLTQAFETLVKGVKQTEAPVAPVPAFLHHIRDLYGRLQVTPRVQALLSMLEAALAFYDPLVFTIMMEIEENRDAILHARVIRVLGTMGELDHIQTLLERYLVR